MSRYGVKVLFAVAWVVVGFCLCLLVVNRFDVNRDGVVSMLDFAQLQEYLLHQGG